jgi:hypothetical protein
VIASAGAQRAAAAEAANSNSSEQVLVEGHSQNKN